jgi:hypothetical protein
MPPAAGNGQHVIEGCSLRLKPPPSERTAEILATGEPQHVADADAFARSSVRLRNPDPVVMSAACEPCDIPKKVDPAVVADPLAGTDAVSVQLPFGNHPTDRRRVQEPDEGGGPQPRRDEIGMYRALTAGRWLAQCSHEPRARCSRARVSNDDFIRRAASAHVATFDDFGAAAGRRPWLSRMRHDWTIEWIARNHGSPSIRWFRRSASRRDFIRHAARSHVRSSPVWSCMVCPAFGRTKQSLSSLAAVPAGVGNAIRPGRNHSDLTEADETPARKLRRGRDVGRYV